MPGESFLPGFAPDAPSLEVVFGFAVIERCGCAGVPVIVLARCPGEIGVLVGVIYRPREGTPRNRTCVPVPAHAGGLGIGQPPVHLVDRDCGGRTCRGPYVPVKGIHVANAAVGVLVRVKRCGGRGDYTYQVSVPLVPHFAVQHVRRYKPAPAIVVVLALGPAGRVAVTLIKGKHVGIAVIRVLVAVIKGVRFYRFAYLDACPLVPDLGFQDVGPLDPALSCAVGVLALCKPGRCPHVLIKGVYV